MIIEFKLGEEEATYWGRGSANRNVDPGEAQRLVGAGCKGSQMERGHERHRKLRLSRKIGNGRVGDVTMGVAEDTDDWRRV